MSDDRMKLKRALIQDFGLPEDYDEFGHFNPTLRGRPKDEWGFKHKQIGQILVAQGYNWKDSRCVSTPSIYLHKWI